jgi:hypothetical protein
VQAQSQIKRRLSEAEGISAIRRLLGSGEHSRRSDLARQLCEEFGFYDGRGEAQTAGCLKALKELSQAGHFVLPAPRSQPSPGSPRRLGEAVPAPERVPNAAGEVQGLEIVRVDSEERMRIWNELMEREHPCGAGPLVGPQLRYLIGSAHGWLGGFAFSAAAIKLRDRDRWLGWDDEVRRSQLHRVVSMSRFLLRPRGCKNLASHVLGRAMRRVSADFEAAYGYRPYLVESFVDTARFEGSCYRAANWVRVGQTQGRGRQDRAHRYEAGIKAIYVYPLVEDFRERLGGQAPSSWVPLAAGEGLERWSWAEQEFGGAPLGDERLSRRLVASAARLAEQPGREFSSVAQGDVPAVRGYYRLIDKPADSEVTMAAMLAPHQARTRQRIANEAHVLCVSDGTTLDYTGLAECEGLGATGSNQTAAKSRGIKMHSTLAINNEGIPLGVVDARCRTPDPDAEPSTASTPIEEKKSYDWVLGLKSCMELAEQLPETRITCVMDREADFFELFDFHRQNPCVDLLIRAKHNRQTTDRVKLFDRLRESDVRGTMQLSVKRQSARPKRSKQQARPRRAAREATLELHYELVEFAPAKYHKDKENLRLWAVLAREKHPPEGVKRLEWCVLSSREITSPTDAEQCLKDYALRWRIEDWHRVIKTGCRVQDLAHESVERLERSLAINLVIAWRIMVMTLLGREVPELPAEVLFSDIELEVLTAWANSRRYAEPPSNLGEAVRLTAMIGGYLGRKHDPPPGHELMWYGYQNLSLMCMGYELRNP